MLRKMVRAMLVTAGYQVLEADSAEGGLALYRQQGASLIIIDMLMSGTDGLKAIGVLVTRDPCPKIIAILGSNPQSVEGSLNDAVAFGAKRVLLKPV